MRFKVKSDLLIVFILHFKHQQKYIPSKLDITRYI